MIERGVRSFGRIRVDTSQWPLIFWDWPAESASDDELARAFECVGQLWADTPAGTKSFTVVDLSQVKQPVSARQRRAGAEFTTRHAGLMARSSLGGALIMTSPVIRATVTAVNWLRPPPIPVKAFATRSEAVMHALAILESHLGRLPPELERLRRSQRGTGARV